MSLRKSSGSDFHLAQSGADSLFTQAALSDLLIISKSGIPKPPSFLSPIIVVFLIFGFLWLQIKSTICLLTLFTKSSEMGRTAETKVNLESAKDFTMLIFPYRVKSLEDQTLRHFSKEINLVSKFLLSEMFWSVVKQIPRALT